MKTKQHSHPGFLNGYSAKEYHEPITYTEEDYKNAYIQGVKDYSRSSKGLDAFLEKEVDLWFNNNRKK